MLSKVVQISSYITFLAGIIFGLHKEVKKNGKTDEFNFLVSSYVVLLCLFAMVSYCNVMKCRESGAKSDLFALLRAAASILFTTDLFLKNEILPDKWNYSPVLIMATLHIIYLMQAETGCDRTYLALYVMLNFFAQIYVACKTGAMLIGIAAAALGLTQSWCGCDMGTDLGNFMSGIYCATADGQGFTT